jgi:hypothetical protein
VDEPAEQAVQPQSPSTPMRLKKTAYRIAATAAIVWWNRKPMM